MRRVIFLSTAAALAVGVIAGGRSLRGDLPQREGLRLHLLSIPSAASMCYDAGGNQLVIPMNPNNSLAFVRLE